MKNLGGFLLLLIFFICEGEAVLPVHPGCVNHSSTQCHTWKGYQSYKKAGCLYEDNKNSKCKKNFCISNCLPKRTPKGKITCPKGKVLQLCKDIRPGIPFNEIFSYEFSLCKIFSHRKPLSKKEWALLDSGNKKTPKRLVKKHKCSEPIFRDSRACSQLEKWFKDHGLKLEKKGTLLTSNKYRAPEVDSPPETNIPEIVESTLPPPPS